MDCPECKSQNPEGIKYCGECGTRLIEPCPQCGFLNPPTFNFCGQCKQNLTARFIQKEEKQIKSERKYVTVVFSDLAGYTAMTESMDPEDVRSILENIFKKVSLIIQTYDGFIERYIGDSVMAVFGIPKTHEDDPARAIRAAMEIHEAVNSMNSWVREKLGRSICMHTGINTGLALTGTVNTEDGTHGLTGLDVNIASRLEGIAEDDEIIVGHGTYLLARKEFNFNELKPVTAKGKQGPIRIFKVISRKSVFKSSASHGFNPVFVGRKKEMQALHNTWNQLINLGTGSIVSITGEPGIGKSKLFTEYKSKLSGSDFLMLHSQSSLLSRETSYGTFLEILKNYSGIKDTDDSIKSWDKLEVKLNQLDPGEVVNTLPYLATILSIQVKGNLNKKVQFLDAETLKSQIFRAFYLFVKSLLKRQPFVLVFEDFHWADDSTIELLIHLLPLVQQNPFQIIFICRDTDDNPLPRLENSIDVYLQKVYTRIDLKALPKEDITEIAVRQLGLTSISSQLSGLIHRKSEGNPLYLEELIRMLTEHDLLEKNLATGQYTIRPLSGKIQIPDTLRGLVSSSVDNLDKNIKEVLKTASVIGRSFLYRLLKSIEGQGDVLDVHLLVLINQNLIKEKEVHPELEYYFYHDLIKDAVYETILLKERKELHLKIAETIELLFEDQIEKFYSLLSYHYSKASEWNKASRYFRLAGDQANRIAGDSEALAHYKKAISAHEELFDSQLVSFEKAVYTRKLGEIYFRRGENDKALESLKQAFELLGISYPFGLWQTRIGIAKQLGRQIFHRFSFYRSGFDKRKNDSNQDRETGRIFESIAWIDFFINQERLAYDILAALNFVEKLKNPNKIIMAYSGFAFLLDTLAFFRFAGLYHDLSEKLLDDARDDNALATFYVCKAIHFDYIGEWDQAIENYTKAADLYQNIGHIRKWGSSRSLMIFIYSARGDFSRVNEYSLEMIKIGVESGDRQLKGWGLGAKAVFDLRMGHLDEAVEKLLEAKMLLESIPDYYALVVTQIDLMHCYVYKKQFNDAHASIKRAQDLILQKNLKGFVLSLFKNAVCDFYLRAREQGAQIDEEITLRKVKKQIVQTIGLGRKYKCGLSGAYRVTGNYYRLKGRLNKAHGYWEKGLEISQDLGARYEEGLIWFEMGRHLDDMNHLNKAKNIFQEINSKYELSLLNELADISRPDS